MILCGINCNIKPFNLYMDESIGIIYNLCAGRIETLGLKYCDKETALGIKLISHMQAPSFYEAPCNRGG